MPALVKIGDLVKSHKTDAMAVGEIMQLTNAREVKIREFLNLATGLRSGYSYAVSGLDPDTLNEFPAQRLFSIIFDRPEPVNWPTFWPACGGRLYAGEMVALKWDPVWVKISAFGLPVAPFQLNSGYELEDVDRDEAESLGLIRPHDRVPATTITVDLAELRRRVAAALPSGCNPV